MVSGEKTKELWSNLEYRKHMKEVHKGQGKGRILSKKRKLVYLKKLRKIGCMEKDF